MALICQAVAEHRERESPFGSEVELDESYFGALAESAASAAGERSKTVVFGIYRRNGRVYTGVGRTAKRQEDSAPNC